MLLVGRSNGGAVVQYYVDSVAGSDSNNGLTPSSAFANPSAVPWANNLRVAFKYGSTWFAELDLSTFTGIRLTAYGTASAGLPVIDGTNVVSSWTAATLMDAANVTITDAAGATILAASDANVWQASVSQDSSGDNRLTVYENDNLLTRVTTQAVCAITPGSFPDIQGGFGSPLIVSIQTSDSSNPNSNGKTYRVTVRHLCLLLGDNCTATGIRTQRAISNNGSLQFGVNALGSRLLANYGTKHNFLFGSGYLQDVVAVRCDPVTSYEPANVAIVWFTNDAAGKTLNAARLFALKDGYGDATPFISHDNVGHTFGTMTCQQIACVGYSFGFTFGGPTATCDGFFSKNQLQPFACFCDNLTIRYAQTQATSFGPTGLSLAPLTSGSTWLIQDSVFYDVGSFNGLFRLGSGMNGCTTQLLRCVLYHGGRPSFTDEGMTSGTISINNTIVFYSSGVGGPQLAIPSGVTYSGNNNVFLCPSDSLNQLNLSYHGVTYNTLAAWQGATGQDANSIALGPSSAAALFSGTVSNGDFRLGTSGAGASAAAIGAGPANYFDWRAGLKSGPPPRWPVVPETLSDAETYIRNPSAWAF